MTLQHTQTRSGDTPEDDGPGTILILVTHGAGCNALIGALTNQPVLIDVGLASLTMAARRDSSENDITPYLTSHYRRRASYDQGTAEEYEVRLMASIDHLRPGSQFLGSQLNRSRSPSLPIREKSPYRYERHVGSPTRRNISKSPTRESAPRRTAGGSFEEDSSPAGIKRASTTKETSNGLWTKPKISVPNHNRQEDQGKHGTQPVILEPQVQLNGDGRGTSTTTNANGTGLWSAHSRRVDQIRDQMKDQLTPKRRWTLEPAH